MNNASPIDGILPAKMHKSLTIADSASSGDQAFINISSYNHIGLFTSACQPAQYGEIKIKLSNSALPKLRPLLRDVDWLLEIGGKLTIETSSAHAHHECYRILSNRFAITISSTGLSCTKLQAKSIPSYGNAKWSICVVSGGNNENKLEKVIQSAAQAEIEEFELLIIGPKPKLTLPDFAKHVEFTESDVDPRFPIVEKKNLCAKIAKYENLLIIHDRFFLSPSWGQALRALRADWDVLVFPVEISDRPELSLQDWCAYSNPSRNQRDSEQLFEYFNTYPFKYSNLRHHSLESNEYDAGVMSCGGSFAVRRSVLLETPIDSRLRWAEIEDGDWSERLISVGRIISYASTAQLCTRSDWKAGTKRWNNVKLQRTYLNIRADIRRLVFAAAQTLIDKLAKRDDLFAKQGCFSKRVKRVLASDLSGLRSLKWDSIDGIYVQGDFETRTNLREVFLELFSHVPVGKSVTLELSSAGFPYLFRSEHIRNCESLCYEASLAFRDEFYVRQLICTKQRNFIVEYVRTKKSTVTAPSTIYVLSVGGVALEPAEVGAKLLKINSLSELPDLQHCDSAAIIISGGGHAPCSYKQLIGAYTEYGAAWSGNRAAGLFAGTLLASAALIRGCLKHPAQADNDFQLKSLEKQLILEGFWPKILVANESNEKK